MEFESLYEELVELGCYEEQIFEAMVEEAKNRIEEYIESKRK